jgi:RimJ/RimL family protein N-acetyltransferase
MVRADGGDPDAFARFVAEHMAESGRGGSPHFALSRTPIRDEVRSGLISRLLKSLDEPLWGRAWVLVEPSHGRFVGHLELRGGRVHAELHRATLGVGMLRSYTGRGHGRRLVEAAVGWARQQSVIEWIDLGVFASNVPARKLYLRMGFVEIGLRRDAYRIDADVAVDDVLMTLKLR